MIVTLTGFMGSGKSSVAAALSGYFDSVYDLDTEIVSREGRPITDIFSQEGEAAFREKEYDTLKSVLDLARGEKKVLISLGGGTLEYGPSAALVRKETVCVFLDVPVETLTGNLYGWSSGRPALRLKENCTREELRERICELLSARETNYRSAAAITVRIPGTDYAGAAEEILKKLVNFAIS